LRLNDYSLPGFYPKTSTNKDAKTTLGETLYGGKILRYKETIYKDKNRALTRTFFVQHGDRFEMKSEKEVRKAVANAYMNSPNKLRMGKYYSKEVLGFEYTCLFLKAHYVEFLSAQRKQARTGTGRTLPHQHSVLWFEKEDENGEITHSWYDVFTKSKFQEFNTDAQFRIN
jgi:hypothetical protein